MDDPARFETELISLTSQLFPHLALKDAASAFTIHLQIQDQRTVFVSCESSLVCSDACLDGRLQAKLDNLVRSAAAFLGMVELDFGELRLSLAGNHLKMLWGSRSFIRKSFEP